jgi:hypothetical protein
MTQFSKFVHERSKKNFEKKTKSKNFGPIMSQFSKFGHEWSKKKFEIGDMRGPKFGENLAHVRFLTFFSSLLTGSQNGLSKFFQKSLLINKKRFRVLKQT